MKWPRESYVTSESNRTFIPWRVLYVECAGWTTLEVRISEPQVGPRSSSLIIVSDHRLSSSESRANDDQRSNQARGPAGDQRGHVVRSWACVEAAALPRNAAAAMHLIHPSSTVYVII
jgi:hypothetical protein